MRRCVLSEGCSKLHVQCGTRSTTQAVILISLLHYSPTEPAACESQWDSCAELLVSIHFLPGCQCTSLSEENYYLLLLLPWSHLVPEAHITVHTIVPHDTPAQLKFSDFSQTLTEVNELETKIKVKIDLLDYSNHG